MPITEQLERDRANLETKLASLDAEQKRIFFVAPAAVLAVPAGIFFGPLLAFGVVALTLGIVGVGLYIINGHRYEYQTMLSEIERKLGAS